MVFDALIDRATQAMIDVAKNKGSWSGQCPDCEHLMKTQVDRDSAIVYISGTAWCEISCPNCTEGKIALRFCPDSSLE